MSGFLPTAATQSFRFSKSGTWSKGVAVGWPFGGATFTGTTYDSDPWTAGYANWTAAMPGALQDSMVAAGFNTIRITVSPGPMLQTTSETQLSVLIGKITAAVDDALSHGLKCIVDIHLEGNPSANPGFGSKDVLDGINGPMFQKLCQVEQRIAQALRQYWSSNVTLELFNEPPTPNGTVPWLTYLQVLFDKVRQVNKQIPIMVTASTFAALSITDLTSTNFDANTMFTFHDYQPVCVSLQSLDVGANPDTDPATVSLKYIQQLPYPSTNGVKSTAITNMTTLVNASALTSGQKTSVISNGTTLLNNYFDTPQNDAWISAQMDSVSTWADSNSVARNRITIGEFGILGPPSVPSIGASQASAANYLKAKRQAAEAHGFGWSAWELIANNVGFCLTDNQTLISAYNTALFT